MRDFSAFYGQRSVAEPGPNPSPLSIFLYFWLFFVLFTGSGWQAIVRLGLVLSVNCIAVERFAEKFYSIYSSINDL